MSKQSAIIVFACLPLACTPNPDAGQQGPQAPVDAQGPTGIVGSVESRRSNSSTSTAGQAEPQNAVPIASQSAVAVQTAPIPRETSSSAESGLVGTWTGRGCQGDGPCWSIRINITAIEEGKPRGQITYPSLDCEAGLEFVRWESQAAAFRERYTKRGRCVPDGWLRLRVIDSGKLGYEWAWPDGRVDSRTTVERVK